MSGLLTLHSPENFRECLLLIQRNARESRVETQTKTVLEKEKRVEGGASSSG